MREREGAGGESQSCKVQSGEKGKIENLVMSQKADKILEKRLYKPLSCDV